MSRDRFECFECGFAAEDREGFDTHGLAMACPKCKSLRVEHVFTDDDDLIADGGVSWYDLTAFRRDCLLTLARMENDDARMHGLGMKERLGARYGDEINHGQIYPNLDALVDAGLVEKSALDRRTNSYTLTDAGWRMLREQREGWVELDVRRPAVADGGDDE
ncbi:PadR family transcriptional regulator [Halolamina salina]|uniref:PadR family transcriptional regulator n=1 Tax=Halolamina salina TaxID=1220023 RepID=A0ABD6BBQ4_9EURY